MAAVPVTVPLPGQTSEWMGGHAKGTVVRRRNASWLYQFMHYPNGKTGEGVYYHKNFNFVEYGGEENAFNEAHKYRIEISSKHGFMRNLYRYVTDQDGNTYFEMQLTRGKTTLFDVEKLSLVEPHFWSATKAATSDNWYAAAERMGRGSSYLHTLITGYSLVDHISRDSLDNRTINLREATCEENCKNAKKPRSNTSGIKGVQRDNASWKASWKENKKQKTKTFSFKKFGEEGAKVLAIAARKEAEVRCGYIGE
jgi:hypothetical protein